MTVITGILLAAGRSSRFGSKKLLHLLPEGAPMGLQSARHLAKAVDRTIAIVQPGDQVFTHLMEQAGLEAIPCAACSEGMGASLACGVQASAAADGWIVALADMPFIRTATITMVAQALRHGAPLAAPVQAGLQGHPVGFSREYYGELVALSGDTGARHILERDRSRIVLVPVDDPGILLDIDKPGDIDTPQDIDP